MTVPLATLTAHLDARLEIHAVPDYANAMNGVQCGHHGPVRAVASAVDASERTIRGAIECGANLLLVHHGLFWGGSQPVVGARYERMRLLIEHDIAVYSAHLPLDVHAQFGNSKLLADALALEVSDGFARFESVACGVQGVADLATEDLLQRVTAFSALHDSQVVASAFAPGCRTRRWAICSGAGAGVATLDEASAAGVDTLIVGEGPHWTAVDAPERGLVIIYAGHYATETLGVRALGAHLQETFNLPHHALSSPTGL